MEPLASSIEQREFSINNFFRNYLDSNAGCFDGNVKPTTELSPIIFNRTWLRRMVSWSHLFLVLVLNESLKSKSTSSSRIPWGCGFRAAVELLPRDDEVEGLNPAGRRAFFSSYLLFSNFPS